MKIMAREKSTLRLSPSRRVARSRDAQQEVPDGVGGLLDLVEKDEAELDLLGVLLIQSLLGQQRLGFAMPQVTGRGSDQLGDFVAVLEFGAVNLDDGVRIAQQRLGGGLDDAGLARTGRTQEQQVGHGPPWRGQPGQVHLIDADDLANGFILSYDELPQAGFQGHGFLTAPGRIQAIVLPRGAGHSVRENHRQPWRGKRRSKRPALALCGTYRLRISGLEHA